MTKNYPIPMMLQKSFYITLVESTGDLAPSQGRSWQCNEPAYLPYVAGQMNRVSRK